MPATPSEAAQIDAEILEVLMNSRGEGAVQHGGVPQFQEFVHQGDDDFPAPVVAKVFEAAGVMPIYDIKTGERSFTSTNLLPYQLKKLGEDGQRMFSLRPMVDPPVRVLHRCPLHPDERKPEYDAWGLPPCSKANLTSPLQVEQHMRHRHKVEWATIEKERERLEKEEDRALQRQIAQAAVAGRAPVEAAGNGKRAS